MRLSAAFRVLVIQFIFAVRANVGLPALKADDEEAYMKLIDTAKDTRITHLLRQTDAYLDSLAQAVVSQQNDDVHGREPTANMQQEDGPLLSGSFALVPSEIVKTRELVKLLPRTEAMQYV